MARRRRYSADLPFLPTVDAAQLSPQPSPLEQIQQMQESESEPRSYGGADDGAFDGPGLSPQEESSLLSKTMGGIQYLGESLEKPGYAVRGAMVGKPEALLNLIPFYDAAQGSDLGKAVGLPEAPKVSGWDLADAMGGPANEEGFDSNDIWKFGLEIATNPLSYLSPFSKVAAPAAAAARAAEKAGLEAAATATKGLTVGSKAYKAAVAKAMAGLDDDAIRAATTGVRDIEAGARPAGIATTATPAEFANQIKAGERGVVGIGLPFMEPSVVLGKGNKTAADLAEAVGYSAPVRAIRSMFSHVPGVGGAFDPTIQREADLSFARAERLAGLMDKADGAYVRGFQPLQDAFQEAIEGLNQQGNKTGAAEMASMFDDLTRTWKSTKGPNGAAGVPPDGAQMAEDMAAKLGLPYVPQELTGVAQSGSRYGDLMQSMQKTEDAIHAAARKYGLKIGTVDDLERYTPRWSDIMDDTGSGSGSGKADKFNPAAKRRAVLNMIPQSTKYGNQMVRDAVERGFVRNADGAWEKLDDADHLNLLLRELATNGIAAPANATLKSAQKTWVLEKYLRPSLDDAVQRGLITQQEADERLLALTAKTKITKVLPNGTTKTATKSAGIDKIVRWINSHDAKTLDTGVWNRSTIDEHYNYMKSMVEKLYNVQTTFNFLETKGVLQKAAGAAKPGVPLMDEWKNLGLGREGLDELVKSKNIGGAAKDWQVTDDGARVLKTMRDLQRPETVTELGKVFGKITGLYKGWWTVPRASFHVRNSAGGTINSLAEGKVSPFAFFREWNSTYSQVVKGIVKGDELTDEFLRHDGLGKGILNDINDLVAQGELPSGPFGGAGKTLWNAVLHPVKTFKEGGFNPFRVGTEDAAPNAAIKAGQQMYALVEYMNRVPYYKALRKSGMSPQEAMAHVERAQFNYASRSPLERRVISKLMPFWGWTRNNLPLQVKRMIEAPIASPTGMMVKGMTQVSSNQDQYTPSFLKEGFALPLGGPPDARTFLKAAGLPLEDLNRFVVSDSATGSARRTAQKFAAGLHPGIVMPIEGMTNKQLYTGRPLSELQGYQTGIPGVDAMLDKPLIKSAVHYSPASSVAADAFQWLDPRKSVSQKLINSTTGVKTSTYDAELMREYELQRALNEQAAENPMVGTGTYAYVKPRYKGAEGTQEVQLQLRKARGLSKSIKNIKRKRELEGKAK